MTTIATPAPGASAPTLKALSGINPLISDFRDSTLVIEALNAIAAMLYRAEEEIGIELEYEEAFGLAYLIRTCAAALKAMDEGRKP